MRICQNCGTNQVQRIRVGNWQTKCKCRHCRYTMFDSLSFKEYEVKLLFMEYFPNLQDDFCNLKD